ncbi:MAG TPA: GNAT family protein [Haliangiales bacterium]|nr:GNAT family protein [Haliangiales bacterium]
MRLEPLALVHAPALVAAATESRSTYAFTWVPEGLAAMEDYIRAALADQDKGLALPFATIDRATGAVVGSTRFGNIERWPPAPGAPPPPPSAVPDAVEIGWTWLAARAQRTAINTEAKLLMLGHAFDVWGVARVTLRTDARNARSRAAIERLGAKLDGVLRAHMRAYDGGVRDTACYSILAREWPAVRERLASRRG